MSLGLLRKWLKINMHNKLNLKNVKVAVLVQTNGPSGSVFSPTASRSECVGKNENRTKYER